MKVVISSIDVLANWKTFVIHFFILPILQALVFVAINYQVTASYNSELLVASLLLASGTTAINQMSASFIQDVMRGIDRDLVRKSPYNFYYWGSKLVVLFLFSLALYVTNGILFWIVGVNLSDLLLGLVLSPPIILFGLIVGGACAILGWRLDNHYDFSNFFSSFAMVFSGVVVSYQLYPPLFYQLTYLLPFARTIAVILQGTLAWQLVLMDALIALVWLIIGFTAYRYQLKRIASYTRKGML